MKNLREAKKSIIQEINYPWVVHHQEGKERAKQKL